ncbi:RHS repeat domain-containing protein [Paenibacillus lentus]|uniref:RHS repeat domain-containing protein n=1 Tax=Paenibacillus lentus TaxID=1338368 RepID=UPI003CCC4978
MKGLPSTENVFSDIGNCVILEIPIRCVIKLFNTITSEGHYSIVTDHLGTPVEMYDEHGERVWSCELDIYGNVRKFILKGDHNACPFRYPGQYEDVETGLYYNRFRYYSPHEGMYTQQDPIGLAGGIRLYGYVDDPIFWVDVFGLSSGCGGKIPNGTGKKIHGNSLDSPKPTDLYVVRERRTGEIIRFGETTQGFKKRGQQHARRFSKLGIEVETTLLKGGLSKRQAKALETRYIRSYEKVFGNKPPYNKSYH